MELFFAENRKEPRNVTYLMGPEVPVMTILTNHTRDACECLLFHLHNEIKRTYHGGSI